MYCAVPRRCPRTAGKQASKGTGQESDLPPKSNAILIHVSDFDSFSVTRRFFTGRTRKSRRAGSNRSDHRPIDPTTGAEGSDAAKGKDQPSQERKKEREEVVVIRRLTWKPDSTSKNRGNRQGARRPPAATGWRRGRPRHVRRSSGSWSKALTESGPAVSRTAPQKRGREGGRTTRRGRTGGERVGVKRTEGIFSPPRYSSGSG
jgi:hypothetical protein